MLQTKQSSLKKGTQTFISLMTSNLQTYSESLMSYFTKHTITVIKSLSSHVCLGHDSLPVINLEGSEVNIKTTPTRNEFKINKNRKQIVALTEQKLANIMVSASQHLYRGFQKIPNNFCNVAAWVCRKLRSRQYGGSRFCDFVTKRWEEVKKCNGIYEQHLVESKRS